MYKRLTHSRIRGELNPPPTWSWELFKHLFCHVYTSDTLSYTGGTCIPRLVVFRNYLNNYFVMYNRLTRSGIRLELASPAYLR